MSINKANRFNKVNCFNKGMLNYILLFATVVFMSVGFYSVVYGQSPFDKIKFGKKISKVNQWRFLRGNNKAARKWNHLGFDDSTWRRGLGKFGYGQSGLDTPLIDMRGKYSRLFVRSEFTVNPKTVTGMNLSIICDGPFIAYINGIEVARSNKKITEAIDISGFCHELLNGKNVLAIECANNDINSERFYFMPEMEIQEE